MKINGGVATVKGREHIVPMVQKTIEYIRKIFAQNCNDHKDFVLVPIPITSNIYIRLYSDNIDIRDWLSGSVEGKVYDHIFRDRIKPCLPPLSAAVGAVCKSKNMQTKWVTGAGSIGLHEESLEALEFKWITSMHFVYPIDPIHIPARPDIYVEAYKLYKKQEFCDLTLVAVDGELKISSFMLYMTDSPMIKTMFTANFVEAQQKLVRFPEYKKKTLEAVAEFIYRGADGLRPEFVRDQEIDLTELFRFAHTYQLTQLVDLSANLITLFAERSDADNIKQLAKGYDNAHLQKLHEFLTK